MLKDEVKKKTSIKMIKKKKLTSQTSDSSNEIEITLLKKQ
jgi:hypothetical protein